MLWQLLSFSELSAFGEALLYSVARPPFVLLSDPDAAPVLLVGPARTEKNSEGREPAVCNKGTDSLEATQVPVALFSMEELQSPETWKTILGWHSIPLCQLASFQKQEGLVSAETLLLALGQKLSYKSLEDWQAWADLDKNACSLALEYGLPIQSLSLWNRLPLEDRRAWQEIWTRRKVKKNFIRQIIEYYYDLSEKDRAKVLKKAQELDRGWGESKAVFPASELRDLLFEARFPRLSENRRQVAGLLKKTRLPKNASLQIPQDMESHELELRLKFRDVEELQGQVSRLLENELQEKLKELFSLL